MKVSTLLILISLFTIATLTNAQVNTADIGCPCDATIVDRGEFMRCVNVGTKELKQTAGIDKKAYKRLRKQYKKRAAKCEFGKEETSEDNGGDSDSDGDADQTTLDSGDSDSDDGEKKECKTVTKVKQCNKIGGGMCLWEGGISGTCIDKPGGTPVNGGVQGGGQGGNGGGGGGGNMNAGGGSNNSKPNGQGKPDNGGGNGNNNKPNGQIEGKPMDTGSMNVGGGSNTKPNGQGNNIGSRPDMNVSGGQKPINGGGKTKPPWAGQGDTEDSVDTETSADAIADGDDGQLKDCSLIIKSNQCTNKWGGACSWISGTCVGNTVAVSKQSSLQEADGTIPQPFNSSIKVKGKFSSLIFYAAAMLFYHA